MGKKVFNPDYIVEKGFDIKDIEGDFHCFVSRKTYFGISTGDDKKLHIEYSFKSGRAHIFYISNRGEEYDIFYGRINNEEEFESLWKMLEL